MATKTNRTKPDPATEKLYRVLCDSLRLYIARKLGRGYSEDEFHEVFVIGEQAIRESNLRDPKRLMEYFRIVVRNRVAAQTREIIQRRQHVDAGERGPLSQEKRDQSGRA